LIPCSKSNDIWLKLASTSNLKVVRLTENLNEMLKMLNVEQMVSTSFKNVY